MFLLFIADLVILTAAMYAVYVSTSNSRSIKWLEEAHPRPQLMSGKISPELALFESLVLAQHVPSQWSERVYQFLIKGKSVRIEDGHNGMINIWYGKSDRFTFPFEEQERARMLYNQIVAYVRATEMLDIAEGESDAD